jgi:hypothetical protein
MDLHASACQFWGSWRSSSTINWVLTKQSKLLVFSKTVWSRGTHDLWLQPTQRGVKPFRHASSLLAVHWFKIFSNKEEQVANPTHPAGQHTCSALTAFVVTPNPNPGNDPVAFFNSLTCVLSLHCFYCSAVLLNVVQRDAASARWWNGWAGLLTQVS